MSLFVFVDLFTRFMCPTFFAFLSTHPKVLTFFYFYFVAFFILKLSQCEVTALRYCRCFVCFIKQLSNGVRLRIHSNTFLFFFFFSFTSNIQIEGNKNSFDLVSRLQNIEKSRNTPYDVTCFKKI